MKDEWLNKPIAYQKAALSYVFFLLIPSTL
jgi:hypothetical protein